MPMPIPENGLVISYSYLWQNEYSAGKLEGLKNRPCAIILVVEKSEAEQIVTVAPMTHTPPQNPAAAIEIPAKVKQHLGLDGERSWIILDDFNQFQWPRYDSRPIQKSLGKYDYGFLPPALYQQIIQKIVTLHQSALKPTSPD
jgi:hypothetical protein